MNEAPDLLEAVIQELERRKGNLQGVADALGMSYDTVLRIRRRENDPGYSKVKALHAYLFGAVADERKAA